MPGSQQFSQTWSSQSSDVYSQSLLSKATFGGRGGSLFGSVGVHSGTIGNSYGSSSSGGAGPRDAEAALGLANTNGASTSDYWSQTSGSQQDDSLPSYCSKPALFQKNLAAQKPGAGTQKSWSEFHDMQQQSCYQNKQREMLDTFVKLLKECSFEIKTTLDSVKEGFSSELKGCVDQVDKSCEKSEKLIQGVEDFVKTEMDLLVKGLRDENKLLEDIARKDAELKVKDEQIRHLQVTIDELRQVVRRSESEDHSTRVGQTAALLELKRKQDDASCILEKIMQVVESNSTRFSDSLDLHRHCAEEIAKAARDREVMRDAIASLRLDPNVNRYAGVPGLQSSSDFMTSNNKDRFAVAGANEAHGNLSLHGQHFIMSAYVPGFRGQYSSASHVNAPNMLPFQETSLYNSACGSFAPYEVLPMDSSCGKVAPPLAHYSPIAPFVRKFGTAGKPSPTAVVAPCVREEASIVKQEVHPSADCCGTAHAPATLLRTPSLGDDIFQFNLTSPDSNVDPRESPPIDLCIGSQKTTELTGKLGKTVKSGDGIAKATPVQRSIRRYGRIKKCAGIFSPLAQGKADKKVTLNDHWKLSKNSMGKDHSGSPVQVAYSTRLHSRGLLAMKRKQFAEAVFSFNDDDVDLKQIVNLVHNHKQKKFGLSR